MKKYLFTLMMVSIAIGCTQPKVQNSTKIPVFSETDNDRNFVSDTLTTILKQLKLKYEDCYSSLILKKLMPGNQRLTIWVIPEITLYSKDDYNSFYGHVLLADTKTGKIVSKYHNPHRLELEGTDELIEISIDSYDYYLNDDKIVFSITQSIRGSSNIYYSGGSEFTKLFVQEGDSLHCIFSYSPYNDNKEDYSGSEGNSRLEKKYTTKLINMQNKTNGFYDFALQTESDSSEVEENYQVVSMDVSSDSLLFFHYQEDGYKETKKHTSLLRKPFEYNKKRRNYYGKTLEEVYQIIYEENESGNQRYMCRELPLKNSKYTMKYEREDETTDSIRISYKYSGVKDLSVFLITKHSGYSYYRFESVGNNRIFISRIIKA